MKMNGQKKNKKQVNTWTRFLRAFKGVPDFLVFKGHLDYALSNMLSFFISPEKINQLDYMIFAGLL